MALRPRREFKRNLGEHEDYTSTRLIMEHFPAEIKQEYTRMRKMLRRNVDRIKQSGEFDDAQIIRAVEQFPAASQIADTERLAMKLAQLEMVLSAPTSTLTGLKRSRQDVIEHLQDRGYSNITKENFGDFTRFMESTRSIALSILRYSYSQYGQAQGADRNKRLEIFQMAQRKGISVNSLIRDFRFYVNHADELSKLPDYAGGRKVGIKTVRKTLKQRKL